MERRRRAAVRRARPAAAALGSESESPPLALPRFFDVDNVRQAVRRINKMPQRELQARRGGGGRQQAPRYAGRGGAAAPGRNAMHEGRSPAVPPSPGGACRTNTRRARSSLTGHLAPPAGWLQEMFQRVYGVRSCSNNNLWLRKKLIEAVNTRPRGGSGSEHQGQEHGAGGAVSPGDDGVRRRRKKSAPTRASDGMQVRPRQAGREQRQGSWWQRRRRCALILRCALRLRCHGSFPSFPGPASMDGN